MDRGKILDRVKKLEGEETLYTLKHNGENDRAFIRLNIASVCIALTREKIYRSIFFALKKSPSSCLPPPPAPLACGCSRYTRLDLCNGNRASRFS